MELPGTKSLHEVGGAYWCDNCMKYIDEIFVALGDGKPQPACQECLLEEMIEKNITFGDADSPIATEENEEEIICQYPDDMLELGLQTDVEDDDEPMYELGPSCMRVPAHQMRLLPSGDMN